MDSLTLFVKMLDVFVFLVKCLGIAMLAATGGLLIKLLPKKLQSVVRWIATALLFIVLLGENALNIFVVSAIRQGIWVLSALGILAILQTVKFLCDHTRRLYNYTTFMASGTKSNEPCIARQNFKIGYFSSYLRQTPVMLS